jgi:hypothetical protein
MIFFKDERPTRAGNPLAIAHEDGIYRGAFAHRQSIGADREQRAGREAHEIDRVGHRMRFVEIVDAPHQAAFGIAPGAEILDMQIADGEKRRRRGELGTGLGIERRPAIEGCAQEREGRTSSSRHA